MPVIQKRNVTISLSTQLIQKVKVLAAKRSTSISGLLAAQVEALVSEEDRYERAAASTVARMERGFDLGGGPLADRDALHER